MLDVAELFKSGENELTELKGDGDFRSPECLELLDEADIVVTIIWSLAPSFHNVHNEIESPAAA